MTAALIAQSIHDQACATPDADHRRVSPDDVLQNLARLLREHPGYAAAIDDVIVEIKRILLQGLPT